jgi:hypothetical protein
MWLNPECWMRPNPLELRSPWRKTKWSLPPPIRAEWARPGRPVGLRTRKSGNIESGWSWAPACTCWRRIPADGRNPGRRKRCLRACSSNSRRGCWTGQSRRRCTTGRLVRSQTVRRWGWASSSWSSWWRRSRSGPGSRRRPARRASSLQPGGRTPA